MPSTPEQSALLATGRWAWLADFLDRWYAEPLRAEDGSTPEDIAGAEERIGRRLPRGLGEWFTLVGRRLRMVQDAPATPESLEIVDGAIEVWTENQGGWSILIGDGEDPACVLGGSDYYRFEPAPLTAVLRGMLLSDTIAGACSGTHIGPLGRLAPSVRGGVAGNPSDHEHAAIASTYGVLPIGSVPDFGQSLRGDGSTVVRTETWLEWMTADDEAYARIAGLIALDPDGGEHVVVLALEDLTSEQRNLLATRCGILAAVDDGHCLDWDALPFGDDAFTLAVAGLGHLGMATYSPLEVRFHVTTTRPQDTARALLAAVPTELTHLTVLATRPVRISTFQVVHPADRAEYTLPIH